MSGAIDCDDGEADLDGNCYQLHSSFKTTWSNANSICSTVGFGLAAIKVINIAIELGLGTCLGPAVKGPNFPRKRNGSIVNVFVWSLAHIRIYKKM